MSDNPSQKPQSDKFKELARELETNEDEAAFDRALKRVATASRNAKVCPECGHVFQGNGWDGIDAHWRAKHERVMPYSEAWPLLQSGKYKPAR